MKRSALLLVLIATLGSFANASEPKNSIGSKILSCYLAFRSRLGFAKLGASVPEDQEAFGTFESGVFEVIVNQGFDHPFRMELIQRDGSPMLKLIFDKPVAGREVVYVQLHLPLLTTTANLEAAGNVAPQFQDRDGVSLGREPRGQMDTELNGRLWVLFDPGIRLNLNGVVLPGIPIDPNLKRD